MTAETRDAMDDLEITKRCAEAMGNVPDKRMRYRTLSEFNGIWVNNGTIAFDPLRDDTQAMAMVKKLDLNIVRSISTNRWIVLERGHPNSEFTLLRRGDARID